MKKIIVLLVTSTLVAINASAQLRTSYFMEGSYFSNELNPALPYTALLMQTNFLDAFHK